MTFSLLSSLLIAVTLVPTLLNWGFGEVAFSTRFLRLSEISNAILNKRLDIQLRTIALYERVLKWILAKRHAVVIGSFAILLIALALGTLIPTEIVPKLAQKELRLTLTFPSGYRLEQMTQTVKRLTAKILEQKGVEQALAQIGRISESDAIFSLDETNTANTAILDIALTETANEAKLIEDLRRILHAQSQEIPVEFSVLRKQTTLEKIFRPEKDDFKIKLIGNRIAELQQTAPLVQTLVQSIPEIRDVRSGLEKARNELLLTLNREALARTTLSLLWLNA